MTSDHQSEEGMMVELAWVDWCPYSVVEAKLSDGSIISDAIFNLNLTGKDHPATITAIRLAVSRPTPVDVGDEELIRHMANRFLAWPLPEHFSPDAGISFNPEFNVEYNASHGRPPQRHKPVGTNLFGYDDAMAMVRFMLEGVPADRLSALAGGK